MSVIGLVGIIISWRSINCKATPEACQQALVHIVAIYRRSEPPLEGSLEWVGVFVGRCSAVSILVGLLFGMWRLIYDWMGLKVADIVH